MSEPRVTVRLTLVDDVSAMAEGRDNPWRRRLARLLKATKRYYGWRVLSVEPVSLPDEPEVKP